MYHTIAEKYYWLNLYVDVYEWCKTCLSCQSANSFVKPRPSLKPLPVENTIFQRWHIDYLQLTLLPEGFKYVLVAVDSFFL